MYQDEAGFGRINKPKRCWCVKGIRPSVPCHHIREYVYVYGAVSPQDGELFGLVMPRTNTERMNVFLRELSRHYPDDFILLVVDNAAWHIAKVLEVPSNIKLFYSLPYTPELNPSEMIWDEVREKGFRNEAFPTCPQPGYDDKRVCGRRSLGRRFQMWKIIDATWFICWCQSIHAQSAPLPADAFCINSNTPGSESVAAILPRSMHSAARFPKRTGSISNTSGVMMISASLTLCWATCHS